ncbi:MAG: L,D-transpeptidase family protein [Gemmatimonas sp.]
MMIKRILTVCAAVTAGAAMIPLAQAQQAYPVPPGQTYSTAPQPYPAGSAPNFDSVDDEDTQAAPPPAGPVMSPNDPRYGRPLYSDRSAPTGPVLSPDDPRYGRPAGASPAYSTANEPTGPILSPNDPRYGRPAGASPAYSTASEPTGPILSPNDPRYGRPAGPPPVIYANQPPGAQQEANADPNTPRPPEGVGGGQGNATGALQQPSAGDNGQQPMNVAALPPDEQPETGPAQLAPNLRRQEVSFVTTEPPGTIVVDTPHTYLYYILGNGRAIRYGVRVGREGFTWTGVQKITRKKEWPDWYPPSEMIGRQPYLPRFMAGGPGNPLGARAMYLGNTVYRIHGTNQPSTIGHFVSSGCIGMLNEDVEDLFNRVKVGTRVVVLPGGPPPTETASAQPAPGSSTATAGQAGAQPVQMSSAPVPGAQPTVVPPLPAPVTVR